MMARGEKPGPGRPESNRAQRLVDDIIRVFQATEGSMDSPPLLFEVEMVLWPRAAKKWKLVPRGRRRGRPLHDEMAQGRSGEKLATPSGSCHQEQRQGNG